LGVDLQIELIHASGATNYRFAVQVKSAARLSVISKGNGKFISYKFLTSRLNYLCRHIPGLGLIVLYDDSECVLYFDFVENIVNRLSAEKPPAEWKEQESVTIHIPVERILDPASAQEIHEVMAKRFENASILLAARGAEYGLPVLALQSSEGKLDIDDPIEVAKFLTDFGASLFNRRDFEFLLDLLSRLPIRDIERSPEFSFTIALAHAETGRYLDAEYYLQGALAHSKALTAEKVALLELSASEIDYRLGRIDTPQYKDRIKELYPSFELPSNRLSTRLRMSHLDILAFIPHWQPAKENELLAQLADIESEIRNASPLEGAARQILLLYLAGEKHELAINMLTHGVTRYRIRTKTIGEPSLQERVRNATRVFGIIDSANRLVQEVGESIREGPEQQILNAHVFYRLASMFFSFAMNDLMISEDYKPSKEHQPLYQARYRQAIGAYNTFAEKQDLDEAFSSLSIAYEIGAIHDHVFHEKVDNPFKEQLLEPLSRLCKETRRGAFESLIERFLNETLPQRALRDARGFADMSDEEILAYAQTFAITLGLPDERIQNIAADARAIKRFDEAISDPKAALLQNLKHSRSAETMYAAPMIYAGTCLVCGYSTDDSQSVNAVIAEYLAAHGKHCPRKIAGTK
jgi:hypothetical protein